MFPFDIEEDEVEEIEEQIQADYEIDFYTGKLTGRIINGLDAVRQWIQLVLLTDRYFYQQYSWEFGSELNTLIGKGNSKEYVESEVKRMVEDALMVNESITGIGDWDIEYTGDTLTAKFKVETIYGGVEIRV